MFALINTFESNDSYFGFVISRHRTEDAARRAARAHARAVERVNGRTSYVPTIVKQISHSIKVGDWVSRY